jgi:hypothetical protein
MAVQYANIYQKFNASIRIWSTGLHHKKDGEKLMEQQQRRQIQNFLKQNTQHISYLASTWILSPPLCTHHCLFPPLKAVRCSKFTVSYLFALIRHLRSYAY